MKKKKKFIWLILIVAVCAVACVRFCGKKDKVAVVEVSEFDTVKRDDVVTKVDAKGIVEFKESTLVYPHEAKKIKRVLVKVGDQVKKGDLLAEYDTDNLNTLKQQLDGARIDLSTAKVNLVTLQLPASDTELSQSKAQLLQSEKTVTDLKAQVKQYDISIEQVSRDIDTAKTNYENNRLLYENGGVSKNDLDKSYESLEKLQDQVETLKTQRENALASINSAQKNYDLVKVQYDALQNKISDSKVKNQIRQQELQIEQINLKIDDLNKKISEFEVKEIAPVDGKIITVNAVEGDVASESKSLFEIADTSLSNLKVKINVPENSTRDIKLGQSVELEAENSKEISMGKIVKIYPSAQKKQVNTTQETVLEVEAEIIDAKNDFKKGYSIDANIITSDHKNVLVVPLVATMTEDDKDFVYIVDGDSIVHKKDIIMKAYSDLYVEAEGLTEGQRVILNPSAKIKEGVRVKDISDMPKNKVKK